MLTAISPVDGRYHSKCAELDNYFSEFALIKYRVKVEIQYYLALSELGLKNFPNLNSDQIKGLEKVSTGFSVADAETVKEIEATINHDVKAVEYFIKNKLRHIGLEKYVEFVHFALTSQDINNTATPLSIVDAFSNVIYPQLNSLLRSLAERSSEWAEIPMLAHTHGQPASPTSVGKEIDVYIERLQNQLELLKSLPIKAKFGGATGNFNAHKVAYPGTNWPKFADHFIQNLGMQRMEKTTQIAHYDNLAAIFDNMARINTILIDLCQDIWSYISMEYFGQQLKAGEVGSSTMPHKVNPIDFENAEGNLGIANAIFSHLSKKLPISRLQRDLTDSTVLRNIGVPFAHSIIAWKSLLKGISKLLVNNTALNTDLEKNWAVVSEAIQTILRRELYPEPYEALKMLTRGKKGITKAAIIAFIHQLKIEEEVKQELLQITPQNYLGYI